MRRISLALVLALAAASPLGFALFSSTATGVTLPVKATFYYPWFPETWHPNDKLEPALGRYASADESVMTGHVDAMKYGGLDAAIVSWWGPNHYSDVRLRALSSIAESRDFLVAPYYEKEHAAAASDPTEAELTADLQHLLDGGIRDSAGYLRIGERPVIFVYNAGDSSCADVTRWKNATHDWADFYVSMKVFGGFESCPDQPDTWHQYSPDNDFSTHGSYHANISPGFDKYNEDKPRLARDLTRWCQNVTDLNASRVDWKLVTSFNEWGEGTAVEAGTDWQTESGYGAYLDTMHAVLATGTGCGASPTASPSPTPGGGDAEIRADQTVDASEDAWIDGGDPALNTNTASLRVDAEPIRRAYLKFPGVEAEPTKAVLEIRANSNHASGFAVATAADTWDEGTLVAENAPEPTAGGPESGSIVEGQTVRVDVTGLVDKGSNTLVLVDAGSKTSMHLASSESDVPPRLLLQYGGPASTATPTPTPTPEPSATPAPPSTEPAIVWAVGDICDNDDAAVDCDQVGTLIANDKPDMFLGLGDLQYEQGELTNFLTYYDRKFGAGKGLKEKTFPAPGNHEYNSGGVGYYTYFGALAGDPTKGYQSKVLNGWKIIGTNSNCTQALGCSTGSPQGEFVASELAGPEQCEIVFDHHPAFTDGHYAPSQTSGQVLFGHAYDGGAELFLSGHDHEYQRFPAFDKAGNPDPDGTRQLVVGTGGKNLTEWSTTHDRTEYRQNTDFGALRLVLRTGSYRGEFINVDGAVMDTFSGTCH